VLGLDYRTASLSEYYEALEAHNDGLDPKAAQDRGAPPSDDLKKFMKAHGG
jgi:hypothetical protein